MMNTTGSKAGKDYDLPFNLVSTQFNGRKTTYNSKELCKQFKIYGINLNIKLMEMQLLEIKISAIYTE